MEGVAVVRFTPRALAVGSRSVRPHRAGRVAAGRRSLGRREFPVRARACGHLHGAAQPGRPLRVPRREDRSGSLQGLRRQQHADSPAGRRGTGRRGGSAARPSLLHRRHGRRAAPAAGADSGFRPRTSRPRTSWLPPSGVYATTASVDGIRPSLDHQHRDAADLRRRRSAGDRDSYLRSRSRPLRPAASGCRSSSGCATSARSRTSTRSVAQIEADCRSARRLFGRISL